MGHTTVVVLTETTRVAGVIVGVLGAGATSPNGTRLFLSRNLAKAHASAAKVGGAIRKLLKMSSNQVVHVPGIEGSLAVGLPAMTGSLSGLVWEPRTSLRRQVKLLHRAVVELNAKLEELKRHSDADSQNIRAEITNLRADLTHQIRDLREEMTRSERLALQIDYRGLPVIAISVILTTLTDEIAHLGYLGWLVVIGLSTFGGWHAVKAFIETRTPTEVTSDETAAVQPPSSSPDQSPASTPCVKGAYGVATRSSKLDP